MESQSTGQSGKAYWRSLEDLANSPHLRQRLRDEFPALASEMDASVHNGPSRRRFLQLLGASIALAGLEMGCRRQDNAIRPYNKKPEEIIPGRPVYYATTMVLAGEPIGLLVETHEGRPTKIEGHPEHPNSGGATHLWAQASVLDLYDPQRSRRFIKDGKPATREQFFDELDKLAAALEKSRGAGLAILGGDDASPAMDLLRNHLSVKLPQAKFYRHEPAGAAADRPLYNLGLADVIVCLDCDLLGAEDAGVRYKRQFTDRRDVEDNPRGMNRLYVAEPGFTVTGCAADHRKAVPASSMQAIALALLEGKSDDPWIAAAAADLRAAAGRSLVVAGARQPAAVHDLVRRINHALGNVGKTFFPPARPAMPELAELADAIKAGGVETLVILDGNPAYDAPEFASLLSNVSLKLHLGLYEDETAAVCNWHVPALHYLESWGDARTADGVRSIIQPMIEPLVSGMSALGLLARLGRYETADPLAMVRKSFGRSDGEWQQFVSGGIREGEAPAEPKYPAKEAAARQEPRPPEISQNNIELCFAPDASVFDGRFANSGWLQEYPDPLTKLTWDNAALMSPRTAAAKGLKTGEVVEIEHGGQALEAPVFVLPGHVDWSVTLPLGYGRTRGGSLAVGTGFNAYALRPMGAGFVVGATLTKTGKTYPLATTQEHWAIDLDRHFMGEGNEQARQRALIREGTLEQYRREPDFARHMGEHKPTSLSIYSNPPLTGERQWGMAIDLNRCIGCGACVLACQAENNIPIVGKDEVIRGREMHWLRLDRYFTGDPAGEAGEVRAVTQPMLCQHCENAPCEPVCPVNATVHSPEGLNEMVYNRCIGTRYCSNNCPYKVRRFNFFDYNKGTIRESGREALDGKIEPHPLRSFSRPQVMQPPMQETLRMQKNPDVTVRLRGVMEKCTYCVQRIQAAKIDAKVAAGQSGQTPLVPDGAVRTACQQACPGGAIVFGDVRDPNSAVSKLRAAGRAYEVLGHLNVRPRTVYLAAIRNPNPALAGNADEGVRAPRSINSTGKAGEA